VKWIGLITLTFCPAIATQNADRDVQVSTFHSQVEIVLVPVVVRDSHGKPVGNLTKSDFRLFDKGKAQNISSFSIVRRTSEPPAGAPGSAEPLQPDSVTRSTTRPINGPIEGGDAKRYLLYLFDDLNMRFADVANVRAAAEDHFRNGLPPADYSAIYTFSGRQTLEFTRDIQKLQETVTKLRWRAPAGQGEKNCPNVSYYLADLILVKGDAQALQALVQHTMNCAHAKPEVARQIALAAVNQELMVGPQDTQVALRTLRRAIRRLTVMQGQRILVVASPGFFAPTDEAVKAIADVLDLAAKSDVIIGGLSVRGVVVADDEEDVSGRAAPPRRVQTGPTWARYQRESVHANGDVLKELADGSGGTVFHNNNDLKVGLDRASAAPEFSYVLGFTPTALKPDGSYHPLKVSLTDKNGLSIESRHGYYATKKDAKDRTGAADIDDAIFSRNQINDLPVLLQTGYSKPYSSDDAKVLVVAKIDPKPLHFHKQDGLSCDSLIVVAALFDSEGGYVAGAKKTVNLRLSDETLAKPDPGVTLRWAFDVKPGDYLVRLVVREAESKAMTAINRAVAIH
jgi:VWFA-related protein